MWFTKAALYNIVKNKLGHSVFYLAGRSCRHLSRRFKNSLPCIFFMLINLPDNSHSVAAYDYS